MNLPNGTVIAYEIDSLNRRIAKKVNGTVTRRWIYMDQYRIAAELNAAGTITKRFVYGSKGNIPDYVIASGVKYRMISDHLGSPRLVVRQSNGSVLARMDHDEFGRVIEDTNVGYLPFGFAGGLYDPETKLVRFGARDYDPELGRWTSKDPILFGGGDTNLYGYVMNDPVNWVDPDGLTKTKPGQVLENDPMKGGGGGPPSSAPGGRINSPIEIQPGTNCSGNIGGRSYSGHALDRMQGRGILPSSVENTIKTGTSNVQPNGNIQYHDVGNNITVIVNPNGGVVTVRPGSPK